MSQSRVKVWYNSIFSSYDELYGEEQKDKINYIYSNFKRIFGELQFEKGMDYGCGTGISIELVKKLCKRVYAYDISEKMLELAKKKHPDVTFLSEYNLNESFDLVTCITVLQDSEEPEKDLKNIYQTLHPNGLLIVSVLKRGSKKEYWKSLFEKYFDIIWEGEEVKDFVFFLKKKTFPNKS